MICERVAPMAFRTPISRVFRTVTVMRVFMMLNAATTTMNMSRNIIVFRSMAMESKISAF